MEQHSLAQINKFHWPQKSSKPMDYFNGFCCKFTFTKNKFVFLQEKKKIIGKHKLEKTEYHSRAWLYPGSKHNHTSHGLSLLDRKMTRIMFCLVCCFFFFYKPFLCSSSFLPCIFTYWFTSGRIRIDSSFPVKRVTCPTL